MTPKQVAAALGGVVSGPNCISAPGPGHARHDRSLSVTLDSSAPDGFLVHSFSNDHWQDCRDYVRKRLGLPDWQPGDDRDRRVSPQHVKQWDRDALEVDVGPRPRSEDDLHRIKWAQEIWNDAVEPRGTLADHYLREHRKLALPADLAGSVLRFNARCPWRDENTGKTVRLPALIGAYRSIDDDEITAVQRIALRPDGSKLDRRMLGIVHRAAVKLDRKPTSALVIGEGVETCMAARQIQPDLGPCWALGSVGAISFFPVVDGVRHLNVLGETGAPSKEAIKLCAKRWRRAGRRTSAVYSEVGNDINDALMMDVANG